MKNKKRFISKISSIHQQGFAAVMAIVGVLVVSLGAAVYLKRAQMFSSFSLTQSTQRLKEQELIADAETARRIIIDRLNSSLQVKPANVTPAAFAAYIEENIVDVYNNAAEQTARHMKLSLKCTNQIGLKDFSTVTIQQQPCTFHRDRMPKSFQMTLQRYDPNEAVTVKITQEFKIDRATINRFSYIVTDSPDDIAFGNITFEGPTGLFFADDAVSQNIIFGGKGSGTIFKDILFTSADSVDNLIHNTGAKSEFSRVAFDQPEVFSSALDEVYDSLRNPSGSDPLPVGATLIRPNTLQAAYDACVAAGRPSCSSRTIYSAYEVLPSCMIRIVEKSEWSYRTAAGTTLVGGMSSYDTTMPQSDGNIYALDGAALFHGAVSNAVEAAYMDAVVCAQQTFLAPSFRIGASILKKAPNDNIWLLSTGDITMQSPGFMWLCDASYNRCSDGICTVCSMDGLKTVLSVKNGTTTFTDSAVSLRIQATMTTSGGSFKIPDSFMDAKPARLLGALEVQGLVVGAQPTFTSKIHAGSDGVKRLSGFKTVSMKPEYSLVEFPPPGLAFAVNIGLVQIVTSSSLTQIDVSEAIKAVQ